MNPATTQSNLAQPGAMLMLATALILPFVAYWDTARSIVSIWNSSDTFTHGYIILPISLWLIWQRRETLQQLPLAPFWPATMALALCGFGWLLARLGEVQVVMQYMFAAMLSLTVVAVFGIRIARAIAFPLMFVLLAVPFGEIFIDPLINLTADFTVAALQLMGIPVFRNGPNFEIPSGSWSVVEACSGIRYLISSFTLGSLYAYLTYQSTKRRAIFIALSILVPILANCLRATMIVMIGHLSDMALATGVDHLVYGWLFFGLIMFLMFWIGSYWREDAPAAPRHAPAVRSNAGSDPLILIAGALSAMVAIAIWPLYAEHLDRAQNNRSLPTLSDFRASWQPAEPAANWMPRYLPATAELDRSFSQGSNRVGVSLRYYRNQKPGALLISSSNQLVSEKDVHWRKAGTSTRKETIAGRELGVREARLTGAAGALLVWQWNWIDGRFLTSDVLGKVLQAKEKLLQQGDDGAAIMVFAPFSDREDEARVALRAFLEAHMDAIEQTLEANAASSKEQS